MAVYKIFNYYTHISLGKYTAMNFNKQYQEIWERHVLNVQTQSETGKSVNLQGLAIGKSILNH